jgi:8-oxo-dGTP pyrophosphatase MutT (NUDIX family)
VNALSHVAARLAGRAAVTVDDGAFARAAVALVVREEPGDLELLLIKRAEVVGDPWSGHMALPGGREEVGDASLEDTAVRETLEEIGLDLRRYGRILGALDELSPLSGAPILVRPYVAAVRSGVPPLALSDEVSAAFWVPLATFTAPGASVESTVVVRGVERRVPSYRHGEYVVWGITERILRQFVGLIG